MTLSPLHRWYETQREHDEPLPVLCPECGGEVVTRPDGLRRCRACGWMA